MAELNRFVVQRGLTSTELPSTLVAALRLHGDDARLLEAHADEYALAARTAALRGVRDLRNVRALLGDRAPMTICLRDKQA
jgi:hypothetical protein